MLEDCLMTNKKIDYDIIFVPCPKCGERHPAETRSGERAFKKYNLENAPKRALTDINRNSPFLCLKCGSKFNVRFVRVVVPQPTLMEED